MAINKISYKKEKKWEYNDLELKDINLIVGKNAAGKTRTLSSIVNLLNFIIQHLEKEFEILGEYKVEFEDNGTIYYYELNSCMENNSLKILKEILYNGDKEYLIRKNDGTGQIFSEQENKMLEFSIDTNIPAIFAKRDKLHHKVLDRIISWCQTNMYCKFGSELGKTKGLNERHLEDIYDYSFENAEQLVRNLKISLEKREYKEEFKEKLLKQMADLGYDIESIKFVKYANGVYGIALREKDIKNNINQLEMSQGMFRAFSLITHSLINLYEHKVNLMVIDDIGEGLDYERATKLIKLIIENAQESGSQLLMATNDRHIMNKTPLKYWQVIKRENDKIKFYSYKNNKEIFDEFEFTGLSNFDFFSTEFYAENDK